MAHNLEKRNGKTSFFARGEKAWHKLGQYVSEAQTAEQAIILANLGYTVEKKPLHFKHDGNLIEVPNRFATVRADTNTPLGVVGSNYTIIQNVDAFAFFDAIVGKGEAIFETAGVLGKGEKIFITAKLPDDFEVGGEPIEQYLLFTNTHDGIEAASAGLTPIRVVCNNTLNAAMRNLSNRVSIRHTTNVKEQLEEAHRIMGIASKYVTEVKPIFERFVKVELSDIDYMTFIKDVMKNDRQMDEKETEYFKKITSQVFEFGKSHPTQTTTAADHTLWGAYNAISGWFNFNKGYESAEQRFKSINFGTAAEKTNKAFLKAVSMIN